MTIQDIYNWAGTNRATAPPGGSIVGLMMSGYNPYGTTYGTGSSGTTGGTVGGPTGAGVLAGATPSGGAGPYGMIPAVPDPSTSGAQAIAGNVANLPALTGYAGSVNAFQQGQAQAPYNYLNPLRDQTLSNAMAFSQGQVPTDVADYLQRQNAERMLGLSESQFAKDRFATNLALQSIQLMGLGNQMRESLFRTTPTAGLMNLSPFQTTQEGLQGWQYLTNMLKAAPDPYAAAMAKLAAAKAGMNLGAAQTPSWYNPAAIASKYLGGTGTTSSGGPSAFGSGEVVPASTVPGTGGYGVTSSSTGGYGTYGAVPASPTTGSYYMPTPDWSGEPSWEDYYYDMATE